MAAEKKTFSNGGVAIMTFGFTLPPYTHGRITCRGCQTVVAQCGCPEGCKTVATIDKCLNCACQSSTPGDARLQHEP
jgi:hypothetical protein